MDCAVIGAPARQLTKILYIDVARGRHRRIMGCYLSTAEGRSPIRIDLKADWLRKLEAAWQTRDIRSFIMEMTKIMVSGGLRDIVSLDTLKSATDAVMEAHIAATTVCLGLGDSEAEVVQMIKSAIEMRSDGAQCRPETSDSTSTAGLLDQLHDAGLLATL